MRLDVRICKVEEKIIMTQFELLGEGPPMEAFYANTESVSSLLSDAGELVLSVSSEPFADGEVALAFPPVPHFKEFSRVVRYEHRVQRKGMEKRAPNTPELGVTQVYVNKAALDDEFIAERRPIYFGLSPATGHVVEGAEHASGDDIDVGDETDRAAALAAFDDFLKESIRVQRSGRLTSRQIMAVWAARWGADSGEDMIAGVQLTDVARRFRGVFGVTAVKDPTRIDGRLQRYWSGYAI